jgi:hypothetical protein
LPTISERLNFFYREVYNKRAPASLPAIAINAADELLTIISISQARNFSKVKPEAREGDDKDRRREGC